VWAGATAEDLQQFAGDVAKLCSVVVQQHTAVPLILTKEEVAGMEFPKLVGAGRKLLRWDIPAHYTARERTRVTRNAVAHGNELPYAAADVRWDLDKWTLFLVRRVLVRLGFDGEVTCPEEGWRSSSGVGVFSEMKNKFGPCGG
jgi:hypothetical protein